MPEYTGPIIDAHHHLWPWGLGRHRWLDAGAAGGDKALPMGDVGALRRDVLPADYLAAAAGQGIVATVHVEGGWQGGPPGEESAWLDTLDRSVVAARHAFAVDLAAADAEARIAAEAAHPRAVGLRDILAWHPDPARSFAAAGKMADPAWRRGLACALRHGLVIELMIFPWQMDEVAALVDAHPDGVFVLNHCGSPVDRSAEGMAAWRRGLARLGGCGNLAVKVSNPFAYDHDWTPGSLRPVFDACLEAFGPDRALFGSDFPVAQLHASFPDMMSAYRALAAGLSPDGQAAFFHATAARIYRLQAAGTGA